MTRRAAPAWEFLTPLPDHNDPATTAVAAAGTRITMADGTTLLCGTSGLWNVNLGYGQPSITRAIATALDQASYLTLFRYGNCWAGRAADRILDRCGPAFSRVLFSTSGSAANDLTMKLVRQTAQLQGERVRRLIVGLNGSYHGLTYGSHGLTGEELGQDLYGVDRRLVRHVDPFDLSALRELCDRDGDRICALVVEPVLGSGALPVPDEFVAAAFELAREYGFFVIADEVATGFYRTGPFRASETWPQQPDAVILSKGLTNGTCAAAVVVVGNAIVESFERTGAVFVHGETQAGTPPTAAAIEAVLDLADDLDATAAAERIGRGLDERLARLTARFGPAVTISGRGAMKGLRIRNGEALLSGEQSARLVRAIRSAGAIVHPGLHGIQLLPSLVYADAELDELIAATEAGLNAVLGGAHLGGVRR